MLEEKNLGSVGKFLCAYIFLAHVHTDVLKREKYLASASNILIGDFNDNVDKEPLPAITSSSDDEKLAKLLNAHNIRKYTGKEEKIHNFM